LAGGIDSLLKFATRMFKFLLVLTKDVKFYETKQRNNKPKEQCKTRRKTNTNKRKQNKTKQNKTKPNKNSFWIEN
jgi:hypothetical protein